jgi:hypothetical protein
MIHLADLAAIPHTEEQVAKIRTAIAYDDHIELRTIGGRLCIAETKGDALQFITTHDATRATALCKEWSAEVQRLARRAKER